MSLARVEPSVGGEARIDDDPHQPALARADQVAEVGSDGLDRAVREPAAEHSRPLREQHRPVGRERDVPRDRQTGDQRDDGEGRRGGSGADRVVRHCDSPLAGAVTIGVGRPGPDVSPPFGGGRHEERPETEITDVPLFPVLGPRPVPGHVAHAPVRVAESRPEHCSHLGLSRMEGYSAGLVHIGDGDAHIDGVVDRRVRVAVGVLPVVDRHRERVAGLRLIIERPAAEQLAGRLIDIEGAGIVAGDRVRQGVAVGVGGCHRRADAGAGGLILSQVALAGLGRRECRRTVGSLRGDRQTIDERHRDGDQGCGHHQECGSARCTKTASKHGQPPRTPSFDLHLYSKVLVIMAES